MKNVVNKILSKLYPPKKVLISFNESMYFALKNSSQISKNKYLKTLKMIYASLFKKYSECGVYKLIINERIVEIPFVFQNLNLKEGSKIIEIGCSTSKLSIELASLGYKVIGADLNDYEFTHPNFEFIKGNFLNNNFQNNFFDAAIAVSVIEHCGLGAYGELTFPDGDRKVSNEVYRILKKGGIFLITVPFGIKGASSCYRVYDERSLNSLLEKFKIKNEKYFMGIDRKNWTPVKKEKLFNIDSFSKGFIQGAACILAEK